MTVNDRTVWTPLRFQYSSSMISLRRKCSRSKVAKTFLVRKWFEVSSFNTDAFQPIMSMVLRREFYGANAKPHCHRDASETRI
ncbi:hypothetical protein ABKN59_010539 [Abortiporus biennis]